MATIESTMGFTPKGKIGNLLFYKWRDKHVVRTCPDHYSGKETPLQHLSRQRYARMGKLYRAFKNVIRYRGIETRFDRRNYFMNHNAGICRVEGGELIENIQDIYLTNHTCSKLLNQSVTKIGSRFLFSWNLDYVPDDSFKVIAWVYSKETGRAYFAKAKLLDVTVTLIPEIAITGEYVTGCFGYRE